MAAGNLAVSSTGQIIWYDFGMMSEIAPATKDRLMDMFYAVYRQDADAVISCLQDLGIIVPTGDIMPLRRAIAYFLENINRQAERQETLSAIGDLCICLLPGCELSCGAFHKWFPTDAIENRLYRYKLHYVPACF